MHLNIQELIINVANNDWWKTLLSGLVGVLTGAIISSALAIYIHNKERKQWEQEFNKSTYMGLYKSIKGAIDVYRGFTTIWQGRNYNEENVKYQEKIINELYTNMSNFEYFLKKNIYFVILDKFRNKLSSMASVIKIPLEGERIDILEINAGHINFINKFLLSNEEFAQLENVEQQLAEKIFGSGDK